MNKKKNRELAMIAVILVTPLYEIVRHKPTGLDYTLLLVFLYLAYLNIMDRDI